MTLAIGDRVRFKEDYNSESGPRHVRQASTGLVRKVQVAFNGGRLLTVDVDEGPRGVTVYDFRVEKIEEPAPKFKVGDRVRDQGGETSVVVDPACSALDATYVRVRFDRNTSSLQHGLYRESELTKIEQSVPFFLRNGDIVVNRKTGRKGEVIRGMVYDVNDTFRPTCKGVPAAAIEEYEDHYPGSYDLIKKDAPW